MKKTKKRPTPQEPESETLLEVVQSMYEIDLKLNREVIRRVRDYSTEELIEALREAAVHILAEHNCLGVALTLAHCVNVIEEKLAPVPVEAGAVVSR